MWTSKQRFLTALAGGRPDRLPVTTHHLMTYFLQQYLGGMSVQDCFDHFGLDPILWVGSAASPDPRRGQFWGAWQEEPGAAQEQSWLPGKDGSPAGPIHRRRFVETESWRVTCQEIPGQPYPTARYQFITPKGTLSLVMQYNRHTGWMIERPIKQPRDIDLLGEFLPGPACDVAEVNRQAAAYGQRGLVRGEILGFEVFGQGGCWQDAACLVGIEQMIMSTYDDPQWVHTLLKILLRRKLAYVQSMAGAHIDLIETGGGDASSTVISPRLFDQFVAPYDSRLIAAAHEAGQRVVYHTCGGMMPLLERIAAMQPDAMETLTPPGMGGDVNLAEVKQRIGDKVCLIGGFDQFHHFQGCTPAETRAAVRSCFEQAGAGGGYILSPSDHFFDADPALIQAYADEARQCVYSQ